MSPASVASHALWTDDYTEPTTSGHVDHARGGRATLALGWFGNAHRLDSVLPVYGRVFPLLLRLRPAKKSSS